MQYVEEELIEGNPVEIPNFCIISFNTETQDCGSYTKKHRKPVFVLLDKFEQKYGVSSLKVPLNEGKRKMDLGRITSNLKISKSVAKSILDSIIKNIGENARESTRKEYTVNLRVCKLKFKGKSCFSKWDEKFLENVEDRLTKTSLSLSFDSEKVPRGQYENAKRNKQIMRDLGMSKRSPSPIILESNRNRSSNFSTMSTQSTVTLGPPYDVDKITSISSLDINPEVSTHSAKELQTRKKNMKDSLTTKVGQGIADNYNPGQFSLFHNRPTTPFEYDKEKAEDLREGLQNLDIDKHNRKEVQKYDNEKERFYNDWVVKQEEENDTDFKRERAANYQHAHKFNIDLSNNKKQHKDEHVPDMNESFKKMHNSLVESFIQEKEKKEAFVKGLKEQQRLQKKYEESTSDFDNSLFMKNSYNHDSKPNYAQQRKEKQVEFFKSLSEQVNQRQEEEKRQETERKRDINMLIVKGNDDEYKKRQEDKRKQTREEFKSFISTKEKEISELRELGFERNKEGAKKQAELIQSMIQSDFDKKRRQNEHQKSYLDKQVYQKEVETSINRKIENSFMF